MTINCGNQLAMWINQRRSLALIATLTLMLIWAAPPSGAAVAGRYRSCNPAAISPRSTAAPDFPAARTVYALEPFTIQAAQGVDPEGFQAQLQGN